VRENQRWGGEGGREPRVEKTGGVRLSKKEV